MSVTLENNSTSIPLSLKDCAVTNLNNRKVQFLGGTTSLIASGVAAAAFFSSPISVIIALAVATFLSLGLFLKSLLTPPKKSPILEQPVVIQPHPTPVAEVPVAAEHLPPTSLSQRMKNFFDSTVNYIKENPVKASLAAATVLGAGYSGYAHAGSATAAQSIGSKPFALSMGREIPLVGAPSSAPLISRGSQPALLAGTAVAISALSGGSQQMLIEGANSSLPALINGSQQVLIGASSPLYDLPQGAKTNVTSPAILATIPMITENRANTTCPAILNPSALKAISNSTNINPPSSTSKSTTVFGKVVASVKEFFGGAYEEVKNIGENPYAVHAWNLAKKPFEFCGDKPLVCLEIGLVAHRAFQAFRGRSVPLPVGVPVPPPLAPAAPALMPTGIPVPPPFVPAAPALTAGTSVSLPLVVPAVPAVTPVNAANQGGGLALVAHQVAEMARARNARRGYNPL